MCSLGWNPKVSYCLVNTVLEIHSHWALRQLKFCTLKGWTLSLLMTLLRYALPPPFSVLWRGWYDRTLFLQLLKNAGYKNIRAEDHSQVYVQYIKRDLSKLTLAEVSERWPLLLVSLLLSKGLPEGVRIHFMNLWQTLVVALNNRELAWTVITAASPETQSKWYEDHSSCYI